MPSEAPDLSHLDITFAALCSQPRRAILSRLARSETTLSELAEPFEMTQTAVTKHVHVLMDAGLVVVEKRGRVRYCRLLPEPMKEASDWLLSYRKFWEGSLDALARHLDEER